MYLTDVFRFSISSWVSFDFVCLVFWMSFWYFDILCVRFLYGVKLIGIMLFIIFHYYPVCICKICSDDSSLIPDNGNWYLSFFFLMLIVARVLVTLRFSKSQLLGLSFIEFFSFLLFHWFLCRHNFLYSAYLVLICSPICSFLRWKLRALIRDCSSFLT